MLTDVRRMIRTRRLVSVLLLAVLLASVAPYVAPAEHSAAAAETWAVDTTSRTAADIRAKWEQLLPTYGGVPYKVTPSVVAPYAPGETYPAFLDDGLRVINFARYLAGLPSDVTLDSTRNTDGQYGAVLLATSSTLTHYPPKPADMTQAFYDRALAATSSSNIGSGYSDIESFQMACLHDSDPSSIVRVGHRRWLLNPPMKKTGIGHAPGNRVTTYAFDTSRVESVSYSAILWPAAGLFPTEYFRSQTPWSITLNPARYDWKTDGKFTVTLKRIADAKVWTLGTGDTNTGGKYFNADFSRIGTGNAFIFRPDPATISYCAGDEFEVTLSGDIYAEGTTVPVTVRYRTTFMTLSSSGADPEPPAVVSSPTTSVVSIAGATRIGTAIEASKKAFPAGAKTVVITTGYNWPDALGGAALAGALGGPILLTPQSYLPSEVMTEVTRLGATKAIVLGGYTTVGRAVQDALAKKLGSSNVRRIAGADRYETARLVAAEAVAIRKATTGYDGTAFVTTGLDFPDALAASPLAASKGWPIYLVKPTAVDAATISAMKAAGVKRIIVLGGPTSVSESVRATLASKVGCATERLAGANRYDTAVLVAKYGVKNAGLGWDRTALTTGVNFPDALAGGVLQARGGSVMLLTPPTTLHAGVAATLAANSECIGEVRFLGSTATISTAVRSAVVGVLQ